MKSWADRFWQKSYGLGFKTLPWAELQASAEQSDCGFCHLLHRFLRDQSPSGYNNDETFSIDVSLQEVDVTSRSDAVSVS